MKTAALAVLLACASCVEPVFARQRPPRVDWNIVVEFPATDPNLVAVVACDGKNNYGVALNRNRREVWDDALREHELDHIEFLRTFFPNGCRDQERGLIPQFWHLRTLRFVECLGYWREFRILMLIDAPSALRHWRKAAALYVCPSSSVMKREQKRVAQVRALAYMTNGKAFILWNPDERSPLFIVQGRGKATFFKYDETTKRGGREVYP